MTTLTHTEEMCDVDLILDHIERSIEAKRALAAHCAGNIATAARTIAESLRFGGKLMLCGNGGSAADCQHIAAEFVSTLNQSYVRPGLAAIALTTDSSILTASANDFGFEGVFTRQVQALGKPGDVLIGISTSGNSTNVCRALQYARDNDIVTIAMTGKSGGKMLKIADICLQVPAVETQYVQESHIAIGHLLCALAERQLFPEPTGSY